jgi:hypothetical protein
MLTECPETEVAKLVLFAPVSWASFWMTSTTKEESMMEPSTIASGESGSTPTRTRLNSPAFLSFSSTSLIEELPTSQPTTPFERDQNMVSGNS